MSQEFQQLYAERMGANRDLGGDDDDEDPDDNGYGSGKKEWYETRFYKDMTEFYRAPGRQRMQTKTGKSMSKIGSQLGGQSFMLPNLQESINSRADSNMSPLGSPLRSPGKSPKRGGRLGRTVTEGEVQAEHTLANTDYGLAKIEEDVESHTGGGIATYSVKKKSTTRTTSFVDHNGQVQTQVEV